MIHGHPVVDTDKHFIIDPISRTISNAEMKKTILMQRDHNSERFSFEIDRYIEEHDMTLCNQVEIHYINTGSPRQESAGIYLVDDFAVAEEDDKKCVFTWLVSENATMYAGSLAFLVMFKCTDVADGRGEYVSYRWHSGICTAISISKGMNNEEVIVEPLPDIVAQWHDSIFTTFNDCMDEWAARAFETNFAYEEAINRGYEGSEDQWYASLIAETITAVNGIQANPGGNVTITDTVTGEVTGRHIAVEDGRFAPLRGLTLYGRSIQNGTPSIETQVPIESSASGNVSLYGANIADWMNPDQRNGTVELQSIDDEDAISITGSYPLAAAVYYLGDEFKGSTLRCSIDKYTCSNPDALVQIRLNYGAADGTGVYTSFLDNAAVVVVPKDAENPRIQLCCNFSNSALEEANTLTVYKPMVSLIKTEWEPYVEKQTFAPIVVDLRGIPVSSGGNYTDESGQQWICDALEYDVIGEIVNYEKVVHFCRLTSTSHSWVKSSSVTGRYVINRPRPTPRGNVPPMCNSLKGKTSTSDTTLGVAYSSGSDQLCFDTTFATIDEWKAYLDENEVYIAYAVAEPTVTAYPAPELDKLRSVYSNNGVTTILNDGGADMKIAYAADAKTHYGKGRLTIDDIPGKKVTSINGKTGDVELTAEDIGGVTSVNGQTGEVKFDYVRSIDGKTGDIITVGGVDRVNGQTGNVVIPTTHTSLYVVSVPTDGWVLDSTYGVYSHTVNVHAPYADPDSDLFVDCIVGANFPLLGARCLESNKVTLYMAQPPTVTQFVKFTFKVEA